MRGSSPDAPVWAFLVVVAAEAIEVALQLLGARDVLGRPELLHGLVKALDLAK
jgi:hypothetical protein